MWQWEAGFHNTGADLLIRLLSVARPLPTPKPTALAEGGRIERAVSKKERPPIVGLLGETVWCPSNSLVAGGCDPVVGDQFADVRQQHAHGTSP